MNNNAKTEGSAQPENHLKQILLKEIEKLSQLRAEELELLHVENNLPAGFYFDQDGWLTYVDETSDRPSIPVRICSRLEIEARTRDQANENHGRLLQFNDPDGIVHRWAMPMSLLASDGSSYRQELLSQGLLIAPGNKPKQLLTTYIQISSPNKTVRCAQQTGWNTDRSAFVMHNETIGENSQEPLILQTSIAKPSCHASQGTLEDWQALSQLCRGNSKLLFSVSIAFAPPLLSLLGIESGGVHFRGHSSSGKTTCQRVATSIWGDPKLMIQWRTTSNGLEGIATTHNDCLLCLDEIGQANPVDIGKCAYMLANGLGKGRADRFGNPREKNSWRLLFLSSGEISLGEHMRQAGLIVKAGQEIRVLDISADDEQYGCFEELHDFKQGKAFADRITELSKANYGIAGKTFIRHLIQNQKEAVIYLQNIMTNLEQQHLPTTVSSQVHRAFNRFALAAAAGELASFFKITGWQTGTASIAVMRCFDKWLQNRGTSGLQEEQQVLSHIKHFFEQHGESRFSSWRNSNEENHSKTVNRMGFRKEDIFYIFLESFKKELCFGFDHEFVTKVLLKHGWLMPDSNGNATRSERLPGGSGNTRVYRFTNLVLSS